MTLITFHPAPLNIPSSSWIIFPLPLTGPSSLCKLQLITKIKLSNFSLAANPIAPKDSGSSVSPSPRKHQIFLPSSFNKPLFIRYLLNLA